MPVAPLIVETEEEKRLFEKGEVNSKAKKALRKRSLLEQAPDNEESALIHSMWTKEMSYLSKTKTLPPLLKEKDMLIKKRPPKPHTKTLQPSLHERQHPQIRHDNATPRPQQTQLHDLRRVPTETNLRASLLLRCLFRTRKTQFSGFGSQYVRKPRPRW